jgi:hypothetical protein
MKSSTPAVEFLTWLFTSKKARKSSSIAIIARRLC